MISNFTKFGRLAQSLSNVKSCSFASFPTTDQKKVLFPKDKFKNLAVTDDLLFPQENKQFNGGIEKVKVHL